MQLLQRHHADVARNAGLDALHRGRRALDRRDAWMFNRYRRRTIS